MLRPLRSQTTNYRTFYRRLRRPGPPPFTPDTLPGLAAWYEARFLNGRPAITLPDTGASVPTWADLSGNGMGLSQVASTLQPSFLAEGAGGRPAVNFNSASQQHLSIGQNVLPSGSPRTIFVAGRCYGTNGGTLFCFRRTSTVFAGLLLTLGGTSYVYSDGAFNATAPMGPGTIQSPFVATMTSGGAGQKLGLRLNGSAVAVSQSGTCSAEEGTPGFLLGAREVASQYWNGEIAAVVIYGRLLDASEIAAVEIYLSGS